MDTKEKRVNIETDESYTVTFHCAICMEYKPMNSRFHCEGCTIGELTYEKWYKHVRGDVRKAWESANLRDSAMLKRCGSCGKFLEGVTLDGMEGGRDDCLDPLHTLAIAKGWRPCPRCGIFIELTGGCSIVTCRCGCLFCYACAKIPPERETTVL
ncbi:hypothetical protein DAI22_11g108900 [Oryza sativa Japonica Group]|nr:hypothetical protein DAI22_11g108900 [Oryza sativa Japonica Group]